MPVNALALLIFLAFALPASVTDIRSYRIPDLLVFPCFVLLCVFLAGSQIQALPNRLSAAFLSGLFFFLIRRCTGGLGLGDVKFAALAGLFCGLPWACVAFLAAALTGIAGFLVARRTGQNRGAPLPFAPFITAGVLVAFVLSRFLRFF